MTKIEPKSSPRPASTPTKATMRRMMALLKDGQDLRKRKVRRLKAAVRARRYENDLKLAIAVDRMIGDL